jgi:uncharacterized protein (DUF58 family)
VRAALSLVPTRRLLLGLLGGAVLVALATLSPLVWIAVAVYLAVLLAVAARDARRLPAPGRFVVDRQLPDPYALGAEQIVLVGVSCPAAAGLEAAVADHAPQPLAPTPRVVRGVFDERGQLLAEYATRSRRRGSFAFEALDLRVWRQGGWWIRQFRITLPAEVRVYPDVLAVRQYELAARRGLRAYAGQRRARRPGAATAVAGLRDYLPGDEARRVNWKATARRDRPVTNEFEAERGQQLLIAVDCGRLMTAPAGHLTKLDHAVNAALLLAWVAESQGDRVGLLAFSDRVHGYLPPRRGAHQVHRINEMLYRLPGVYAEPEYADALSYLALQVRGRSLVVLLTDVLDADASSDLVAHALRLGGRHLVLVVAMADPEVLQAVRRPLASSAQVYEWAAGEELLAARRRAFETLQRGGVQSLDVQAGHLSPSLVERYLELKERSLI